MKALLAFFLFVSTAWAAEVPPPPLTTVKGEVLEIKNVESYTYLRLKTAAGERWTAISKAPVKKGDKITIENAMELKNFESKSLKKTFDSILFGNLVQGAGATAAHAGLANTIDTRNIHVDKASGENARTVAEIITLGVELKDKAVLVRGKIVKYNSGIMGKNWLHLRDGTGSEASNDLLVTTTNQAKLGDIVTVKGIVRNDRDFGAGYSYKVLVEDATLQP